MLKNFILVHYKKDLLTSDIPHSNKCYIQKTPDFQKRWEFLQSALLNQQIRRLSQLYRKCNIHLLTNVDVPKHPNLVLHSMNKNITTAECKMLIYGLLDTPALYLDNDIIIFRPFPFQEMRTVGDSPIRCFVENKFYQLQKYTDKSFDFLIKKKYGSQIVWIERPSMAIFKEMCEIQKQYFDKSELLLKNNLWVGNDELPLTVYMAKHGFDSKTRSDIAVDRRSISNPQTLHQYQSVHYTGIAKKFLYFDDFKNYIIPYMNPLLL